MKDILIKKGSTLLLKVVLVVMSLAMLALCIFFFPYMPSGIMAEFPAVGNIAYLSLTIALGAFPFFLVIYQAFKILIYIDKNTAFSENAVKAFKNIKYSALIMSFLYLLNMPLFFYIAQADDAPGLVMFGFLFAMSPAVVATFAAVLERLFQNVLNIKSENDLTV